ncbi:MAG: DUF2723 domain-containing protein [Anaerolineaceae bacterium]|nr:DUF2723 domain-containing protein [Anaerolineaceae bacterium]
MTRLSWWEDKICWLAGAVLLALYLAVLPQDLTWANFGGDGGDFLAAIRSGGVPHPSGYPTYTLLGSLLQHLPFGSPPWQFALLSALPAALAAAWAGRWVQSQLFPGNRLGTLAGVITTLAWGSAPLFWSQAVIIEVHGLQALALVSWLWWLSLLNSSAPAWKVALLSIAIGFSLGNHLTILLLAPAAAWVFYKARRNGESLSFLFLQIILVLGTTVVLYAGLALRAAGNPPINWGGADTWAGLLWLVSGRAYAGLLGSTPPTQILERLSAWASLMIQQFWAPGVLAAAWGAVQGPRPQTRLPWLPLWIFASFSIFAIFYNTADSLVYLIPALLTGAIWIGSAAASLWTVSWKGKPLGKALAMILLAIILVRLPLTLPQVDPRSDQRAANYLAYAQEVVPHNALVFTQNDAETFPLWYLHFGLRKQPGWHIIVLPLTHYDWYRQSLAAAYPDLTLPQPTEAWGIALPANNPSLPVCHVVQIDASTGQMDIGCEP